MYENGKCRHDSEKKGREGWEVEEGRLSTWTQKRQPVGIEKKGRRIVHEPGEGNLKSSRRLGNFVFSFGSSGIEKRFAHKRTILEKSVSESLTVLTSIWGV